jgi:hypothetical protein
VVGGELGERTRVSTGDRPHYVGRRRLLASADGGEDRTERVVRSGHGRYLQAHLRDATLREVEDPNDAWFIGNVPRVVEQVDRFVDKR